MSIPSKSGLPILTLLSSSFPARQVPFYRK